MTKPENEHLLTAEFQVAWMNSRVKQLRYMAGLSLADAATLLGMHGSAISRIENGRISNSATTIAAMVGAYGVRLADFMSLCPQPNDRASETNESAGEFLKAVGVESVFMTLEPIEGELEAVAFARCLCAKYEHLREDRLANYFTLERLLIARRTRKAQEVPKSPPFSTPKNAPKQAKKARRDK